MSGFKVGQKVKIGDDDSTYGRIDMVKGLVFKKYWCFYWGEENGRVTDPQYGTYARWCKKRELSPTHPGGSNAKQ